jgi:outer membrane protein TolC
MIRKILPLAFLSIAVFGLNSTAQTVTELSLEQCINYALKHNYTVKNADLDVLIQKAQNNEVASAAYPHMSAKIDYTNFIAPQYQFFDASKFPSTDPNAPKIPAGTIASLSFTLPYNSTASVSASQILFDGSVFVALKARQTVLNLAMMNGEVTKENVRYNVTKAYYALVIATRQFNILKSSLSFARSIEHDIDAMRTQGFVEKIDVERTSVQVNNLASDSIRIGNMLQVSEQLLKYQMGMSLATPIVLTDTNVEENKSRALSLLEEKEDYDKIPMYNLLQTQLKANELNVMRYKLSAIPSLSVFATQGSNYGHVDMSELYKFNNYASYFFFGVELNLPIFNGMLRTNQLREAKINVDKVNNSIEYLKQGIDFQAEQSRTMLRNAILQAQSQHRNLDIANDVLDLAQKKYKEGVGSNQEVTQAQTDQLRAQTNYFNALLDVINSEADLEKALGLLK